MQVGDIVNLSWRLRKLSKTGIIIKVWKIEGFDYPYARILWSNGSTNDHSVKHLELLSEKNICKK